MSLSKQANKKPADLAKLPILGQQPKNEKEEKYLREICEYEFFNLEEPGVLQKFSYGNTKQNHTFTFLHGGKYTLPRFVARHLESCSTPIWDYRPNGLGNMSKKQVGTKPRFRMSAVFN